MKKTKYILTGFAVFASILILTTTCLARPVQEKTSIDAVEYAEQKLMSSLDALNVKLSRDVKVSALIKKICSDQNVALALDSIKQAQSEQEMLSGFEQLVVSLDGNAVFGQLELLVNARYSVDVSNVAQQLGSAVAMGSVDGGSQTPDVTSIPDWLENLLIFFAIILDFLTMYVLSWIYLIYTLVTILLDWLFGDGDGIPGL